MSTPATTATRSCNPARRPATFTNEPVRPMAAPSTAYVVIRPPWYASCPASERRGPSAPVASANEPTSGPHMPMQCPKPPRRPVTNAIATASVTRPP